MYVQTYTYWAGIPVRFWYITNHRETFYFFLPMILWVGNLSWAQLDGTADLSWVFQEVTVKWKLNWDTEHSFLLHVFLGPLLFIWPLGLSTCSPQQVTGLLTWWFRTKYTNENCQGLLMVGLRSPASSVLVLPRVSASNRPPVQCGAREYCIRAWIPRGLAHCNRAIFGD